ncbi:MAG: DUF1801 domain-containing protein [Ignavibacteriales bacterium]|nr:DUF1801 domain-containing protein [Ignavibacteriales bacterium]MBK7981184.1 DUF1801 domain-containing protein [Ignavibacteriota bacterium]
MKNEVAVNNFMNNLDHPYKEGIEFLRNVIKKCNDSIIEEIKWNAPSYKLENHFATFKLYPPKNIQIVLHTDSKLKGDPHKFHLDDPHQIIKWAAPDRCVITIKSNKEAKELSNEISSLINSWIKQL